MKGFIEVSDKDLIEVDGGVIEYIVAGAIVFLAGFGVGFIINASKKK